MNIKVEADSDAWWVIQWQILEKEAWKWAEAERERHEEDEWVRMVQESIQREWLLKEGGRSNLNVNTVLAQQNMMKRKLEREIGEIKHEEYFPYIHGDLIEEQWLIMNHQMWEELRHNFKEHQKLSHSADRVSWPAKTTEYPFFMKPHKQNFAHYVKDEDKQQVIDEAM